MNYNKKSVEDIDVAGKRVLCRCDFNVPTKNGVITSDKRIVAALPTIKYLLDHNADLMVGRAATIRVSSVIFVPSSGTLKSQRTNTRLPDTSISSMVFLFITHTPCPFIVRNVLCRRRAAVKPRIWNF